MGVSSSLMSSAPCRALEDIWVERFDPKQLWANEEEVRKLIEKLIVLEAGSNAAVVSLVITSKFFSGGAELKELIERETQVRLFLQGFEAAPQTDAAEEEKEDSSIDEVVVDGLLMMSSDDFDESKKPEENLPSEFLCFAICLTSHCQSSLANVLIEILQPLLPLILQVAFLF
jgi:hypothetical protein